MRGIDDPIEDLLIGESRERGEKKDSIGRFPEAHCRKPPE